MPLRLGYESSAPAAEASLLNLYPDTNGRPLLLFGDGTSTLVPLVWADVSVTVAAASIAVTLPSFYQAARFHFIRARSTTAANTDLILARPNNSTTAADYYSQRTIFSGATPTLTGVEQLGTLGGIPLPFATGANPAANIFGAGELLLNAYSLATFKPWHGAGVRLQGTSTGQIEPVFFAGSWNNTSAITSVTFVLNSAANFEVGTRLKVMVY